MDELIPIRGRICHMTARLFALVRRRHRRLLLVAAVVLVSGASLTVLTWPVLGGPAYACYRLQSVGGQWHGKRGPELIHLTAGVRRIRFDHARTGAMSIAQWRSVLQAQRHNIRLQHILFVDYHIDKALMAEFVAITNFPSDMKRITLRRC